MSSKGARLSLLPELFRFGLYKPTQGRVVRQASFLGLALVLAFGCFSASTDLLGEYEQQIRVGVPIGIWLVLCWVAFRLVNVPRFADFLISVESELEKVVWPGRQQVLQSRIVVIVTMLFMGVFLFGVDLLWRWFFTLIHFIEYEVLLGLVGVSRVTG